MNSLPFNSIEEAKVNAKLLCRSFEYYAIHHINTIENNESPEKISLQQTQHLIAQAFGCAGWTDFTHRLTFNRSFSYFDHLQNPNPEHQALAEKIGEILKTHIELKVIHVALSAVAFGCSPEARNEATVMSLMSTFQINEQAWKVFQVEAAYSYHSKYNQRRSTYEIQMLSYFCDKAVAEILGKPIPPKPRKKKVKSKY